jgi:hypothetical protein
MTYSSPPSRPAYAPYEPDSPEKAEERLDRLSAELETNEQAFKDATDEAALAEAALQDAENAALMRDDCPPVGVFNGIRTTVRMQEAWVAAQVGEERTAHRLAQVKLKAADAQRRRLEGQLRAAQSINRNANDSRYRGTGGYR